MLFLSSALAARTLVQFRWRHSRGCERARSPPIVRRLLRAPAHTRVVLQNRHAAAIKEQKEVCTRDIERARVVPALIYASAVYICASPARTAALTRLGYKRSISRKLQSDCYGLRGIWRDAARREEKAEEKRERSEGSSLARDLETFSPLGTRCRHHTRERESCPSRYGKNIFAQYSPHVYIRADVYSERLAYANPESVKFRARRSTFAPSARAYYTPVLSARAWHAASVRWYIYEVARIFTALLLHFALRAARSRAVVRYGARASPRARGVIKS